MDEKSVVLFLEQGYTNLNILAEIFNNTVQRAMSYAVTSLDKQNRSLPTSHGFQLDSCKMHLCSRYCFLEYSCTVKF